MTTKFSMVNHVTTDHFSILAFENSKTLKRFFLREMSQSVQI